LRNFAAALGLFSAQFCRFPVVRFPGAARDRI